MPFKYDANGQLVVQDVNGVKLPVFVHPDNKEAPLDGDATVSTIGRLNAEARDHRVAKEQTQTELTKLQTAYADIKDPDLAKKALEVMKNLDDKKLVDAGQVEQVKREAVAAYEERLQALSATHAEQIKQKDVLIQQKDTALYNEMIGGAFSRSEYAKKTLKVPADMVQARFGKNFGIEDGKIYAVDNSGNKLFSRVDPGNLAGFDEALSMLVDAYPQKDQILNGPGGNGSGMRPSGGAGGRGTISRAQFDQMDPIAQREALKTAQLVD